MDTSKVPRSLTPDLIQQLLSEDGRASLSADYVRLMEIYCVVKAGGSVAQIAVARRLEATEKAALQEEIGVLAQKPEAASRVRALQQEMQELERSIASRIAYLQSISPPEEAVVTQCLSDIDAYFQQLGRSHP